MLVEINRLNFDITRLNLDRKKSGKGRGKPGGLNPYTRNLRSRQGHLCSHSYRKGLSSLPHYRGPVGLAGTLPEHPSSRWPLNLHWRASEDLLYCHQFWIRFIWDFGKATHKSVYLWIKWKIPLGSLIQKNQRTSTTRLVLRLANAKLNTEWKEIWSPSNWWSVIGMNMKWL